MGSSRNVNHLRLRYVLLLPKTEVRVRIYEVYSRTWHCPQLRSGLGPKPGGISSEEGQSVGDTPLVGELSF